MPSPLRLLCVLLAFVLLGGCAYQPAPLTSAVAAGPVDEVSGTVLGLDGRPAAGVLVRGYLVSNNSGSLVSNNSGSLVSNNAGSLVSNNAGSLSSGSSYRVQADSLITRSDSYGRFTLKYVDGQTLNVEAQMAEDIRAMRMNARTGTRDLDLRLAYTGAISGRVTAPSSPGVTNFLGVDVYVPGTSYLAKTDASGRFSISNVAVGRYDLVASKEGLGAAVAADVAVTSKAVTDVGDLALSVDAPAIAALSQAWGMVGSTVTLSGQNFGASQGLPFTVTLGGVMLEDAQRVDDHTLRLTIPAINSGNLVVTVGSIRSNPVHFAVLKNLYFNPTVSYLSPGTTLALEAVGLDTTEMPQLLEPATWSVSSGILSLSGSTLTAVSEGQAILSVQVGDLRSQQMVRVTREPAVVLLAGAGHSESLHFSDGPGAGAHFYTPSMITFDEAAQLLYVTDTGNHCIRRVDLSGHVSTVAGAGRSGFADGTGREAMFNRPTGIVTDGHGGLVVTDTWNNAIRRIDAAGRVTTLLTSQTLNHPGGLAWALDGRLLVADTDHHRIVAVDAQGTVTVLAGGERGGDDGAIDEATFEYPYGLAVAPNGAIYVCEIYRNRIRKIQDGEVTTLAGSGNADYENGQGTNASFWTPSQIALDPDGNLLVADRFNEVIRQIAPDGNVTTLAGHGEDAFADGPLASAQFNEPTGVTVDSRGRVWVLESWNEMVRQLINYPSAP